MNTLIFFLLVIFSVALSAPSVKLRKSRQINDDVDPEEIGGFFQGDIDLNLKQWRILTSPTKTRTGLVNIARQWHEHIVPYVFSDDFSEQDKKVIRDALDEMEEKLCLQFVPRTQVHNDYIFIDGSSRGCSSALGRTGGRQSLVLERGSGRDSKCLIKGRIMHEFIHALGFAHMHSAVDRDNYVTVFKENIKSDRMINFEQIPERLISQFGIPYDYNSVMHYNEKAFSKNGKRTIVPIDPGVRIGQRKNMSELDVARIRAMYQCDVRK